MFVCETLYFLSAVTFPLREIMWVCVCERETHTLLSSCVFNKIFLYVYRQRADTQVLRWDVCVEVGLRSSKRIIVTELRDIQTSFKQLLPLN